MIFAAEEGYLTVVEYLVERGADIEAKTKVSDAIFHRKPCI